MTLAPVSVTSPAPSTPSTTLRDAAPAALAIGLAAASATTFFSRGAWGPASNLDLVHRIASESVPALVAFGIAFFIAIAVCAHLAWSVPALALIAGSMASALQTADQTLAQLTHAAMTPGSGIGVILLPMFGLGIAAAIVAGAAFALTVVGVGALVGARALRRRDVPARRHAAFRVVIASAVVATLGGTASGVFLVAAIACGTVIAWSRLDRTLAPRHATAGLVLSCVLLAASAFGQYRATIPDAARARLARLPSCDDRPFEPTASAVEGVLGVRTPLVGAGEDVAVNVLPMWVAVDPQHDAAAVVAQVQQAIGEGRCTDGNRELRTRAIAARPIPVRVQIEAFLSAGADETTANARGPALFEQRYAHDVRNRREGDTASFDFGISTDFIREGPIEYSFQLIAHDGVTDGRNGVGSFLRPTDVQVRTRWAPDAGPPVVDAATDASSDAPVAPPSRHRTHHQ